MKKIQIVRFREFHRKTGTKSRDGTYLYVKNTNEKGKYYKYNPGDNIDGIVAYHNDKVRKGSIKSYKEEFQSVLSDKKGKPSALRQKAQRYKSKHLGKKLEKVMEKGMGKGVIEDLHNAAREDLEKAKDEMLKNIILDPEVRKLVALEENMKKMSHRIQITLEMKSASGTVLDTIKTYNLTIEEVMERVKRWLKPGTEVASGSKSPYQDLVRISRLGKSEVQNEDVLMKVRAEMIFRKN